MINRLRHFMLTSNPMIHDEEALTTLELVGRIAGKINECVEEINKQTETLNKELDKLPEYADNSIEENIENGTIMALINTELFGELNTSLETLRNRVNTLIINGTPTEGNAELIDARTAATGKSYNTAGAHVRALGDGSAFNDAIRPGTVKHNRIMPGMMGGDMARMFTALFNIPMAGRWGSTNGYYDMDTLDYVQHTGYAISEPTPCEYGDMFRIHSYVFGNKVKPAVVFDASGNALEVLGTEGAGNWDERIETITVSDPRAASISFITGTSYVASFRALRYTGDLPGASAMDYRGYWHMKAKRRTDTITDRAQIKCWYSLEDIGTHTGIIVNARLATFDNLKGWTFRVFGAAGPESYDVQLPISAAAYTFAPDSGLRIYIPEIPVETGEGEPITHLALFFDMIPEEGREDDFMDVCMIAPDANGVYPEGAELHGAIDTDDLNVVPPNASGSLIYRKKIMGLGDSLMSGNTLKKYDSWFDIVADLRDLEFINGGVNGSPVSSYSGDSKAMETRIDNLLTYMPDPDYFVLVGGANDLRLHIPPASFKTAVKAIVGKVRASNPKCKILLGTNWKRSEYRNNVGAKESDYVTAMLEVAEELNVPCVNNYSHGLNLLDPATSAWADHGTVTTGTPDIHFSKEANEYIARQYVGELERI